MTERAEGVARHYQRPGLLDSIDAGLRSAGRDPERPRLEDLAELRSTIAPAGFREAEWRDVTAISTEWLRARFGGPPPAGPPPVLTPQVILGDGFRPAFENLLRNLDEHRVRVVEAIFQRDG